MRTHRSTLVVLAGVVALLLSACDDGGDAESTAAPTGEETTGGSSVSVTLQEFSVGVDPGTAGEGSVTFDVTNIGPEDVHEFVVLRTDLAAADLPTAEDGSVDEEGEGIEVVDEIEDIPVDGNETLSVDLDAGSYALICNIVEEEDGETIVHYANGMRTDFTVG
jgi:hypothetical protein